MHILEGVHHLTLEDLEAAIAGQRSILPLPHDAATAQLLRNSQRVGAAIDPSIALVAATSGSTGSPKGALLTAANLVASADATHQYLGGEGQWLLAMPTYYIAGIQVLVRNLIAGWDPVVQDVSRGFDIATFAEKAATMEAGRRYTALTPHQLLKAMDTLAGIEALRSFDAILVGGGPLRQRDRAAAHALDIRVVNTYGSSETAGGCIYDGKPIPGAKVQISGGRIRLGGPMIAQGYRNVPDAQAFADPGWFRTSDAGHIADGRLVVTGRIDSIIDTGGLKLHPEVLEQQLLELPTVTAACVVGVPDPRLGQTVALAYTGTAAVADIIGGLEHLPRWQLPRIIKRLDTLPTLASGKVDRVRIQTLLSAASSEGML